MACSEIINPTPSSDREKAILIHVLKIKDPVGEEQTLEEMELKFQHSHMREEARKREECGTYVHEMVNSWYILEHTAEGQKISEIFHNLPKFLSEEDEIWLDSTSSAIVGSSLYVLGGHIKPHHKRDCMSNFVQRLDLNNSANGWKTSLIPFGFAEASAEVVGDSICLIPRGVIDRRIECSFPTKTLFRGNRDEASLGLGVIYDTIDHVAYTFKPPPGCTTYRSSIVTYYLPLEGRDRGLVVPLSGQEEKGEEKSKEKRVYQHDPIKNSWEQLHGYSALAEALSSCPYNNRAHAVSNGILYLLDIICRDDHCLGDYGIPAFIALLSAYDLNNGMKLFKKKLPLSIESNDKMWLVPVSNFKLCLLRLNLDCRVENLRCTTILVSLNPHTVSIAEERRLFIDASYILTCLPLDPDQLCLYRSREIPNAKKKDSMMMELYWKRCCRNLLEENRKLLEEVEEQLRPETPPSREKRRRVSECKSFEHKPMLSKEKSILIHVSRILDPTESQGCEAFESHFRQSITNPFSQSCKNKFKLPMTDSWLIIKHTATGPKISEIFRNVPQTHPNVYCKGSSSAIVGTSLYVIGGRYNLSQNANYFSNEIRCLDFQNPAKGWEISNLPYCFTDGYVEVADNFIYLLPRKTFHVVENFEAEQIEGDWSDRWGISCDASHYPWGLAYDTSKHEANPLELPQGYPNQKSLGFHLKGRGVVVPLGKNESEQNYEVCIHNPGQNSWELLDSYSDFQLKYKPKFTDYVVVNDILFLFRQKFEAMTLYAYNYDASSVDWLDLLFKVDLPRHDYLNISKFNVVAVADCTFCFLGHRDRGLFNKGPLYYVKVFLSLNPTPTVSILENACFPLEAIEILNCLPFDSDLYPSLFEEISVLDQQNDEKNSLVSSSSEAEAREKEVYWKQCFKKLIEENKRLQKEMQELVMSEVTR